MHRLFLLSIGNTAQPTRQVFRAAARPRDAAGAGVAPAAWMPPQATADHALVAIDDPAEDKPFCPIADMYFSIAASRPCTSSLSAVEVLESDNVDDTEDDDPPEPWWLPPPPGDGPGGAPGGGLWLAMLDANWLSVRPPVPLESSRLHICVA